MKTLILTDIALGLGLAKELRALHGEMDIVQSPNGSLDGIPYLDVRAESASVSRKYELIVSLHCRQLFPAALVNRVRCVNVHPGFNPFNRGWYPHIFSIINRKKAGVTIHEMDEKLDHGPIIAQAEYEIKQWDTSESVYANIMKLERELLIERFPSILAHAYEAGLPDQEGNVNYKRDFEALKRIDLAEQGSFGTFLDRLRALTHGDFNNAYFVDESGRRVFVRVVLTRQGPTQSGGPRGDGLRGKRA